MIWSRQDLTRCCMFKSQGFDWGHAFQPALRLQAWVAGTKSSWMLWGIALGTSEEWPSNRHRLRISPLSQGHSQLNILATRSTGFCLCWVYSLDSIVFQVSAIWLELVIISWLSLCKKENTTHSYPTQNRIIWEDIFKDTLYLSQKATLLMCLSQYVSWLEAPQSISTRHPAQKWRLFERCQFKTILFERMFFSCTILTTCSLSSF